MGNEVLAKKAAFYAHSKGSSPLEKRNKSLLILKIFRILGFPVALIVAIVYLPFLAINLTFLYFSTPSSKKKTFSKYYLQWEKLYKYWGKYPCCFIAKATELTYFYAPVQDRNYNSLEIGVYTGETSRAFFFGKQIKAGLEYNIDRCVEYSKGPRHHHHLYSADIRELPFKPEVFDNVFCIHSVDDMEFHASAAIKGIQKVVKPGGRFIFSGYTASYCHHNLLIQLLETFGLKRLGRYLFDNIYIGTYNCFNKASWAEILKENGFELRSHKTFIPFLYAGWFDLAYRPEVIILNLFGWDSWLKPLSTFSFFKDILFRCTMSMVSFSQSSNSSTEGISFFIVAQKMENDQKPNDKPFSDPEDLCCPACKGQLKTLIVSSNPSFSSYQCITCNKNYPIINEIPVFLNTNSN
jgi:uncharacterized protein YbaR (Trm112 family)/SAM-dependent methyltransferase